jgi:hypothetical protein
MVLCSYWLAQGSKSVSGLISWVPDVKNPLPGSRSPFVVRPGTGKRGCTGTALP